MIKNSLSISITINKMIYFKLVAVPTYLATKNPKQPTVLERLW